MTDDKDDIEYRLNELNRKKSAKKHMEIVNRQINGSLSKNRYNPDILNINDRTKKK